MLDKKPFWMGALLGLMVGVVVTFGAMFQKTPTEDVGPAPMENECATVSRQDRDLFSAEASQRRSEILSCGKPGEKLGPGELACIARWSSGSILGASEYLCGGEGNDVGTDPGLNPQHDGRYFPEVGCEIPFSTCPDGIARAMRVVDVGEAQSSVIEQAGEAEIQMLAQQFQLPELLISCQVHRIWEYHCR